MMTKITQNKVLSFSLDITILWLFKSKKAKFTCRAIHPQI